MPQGPLTINAQTWHQVGFACTNRYTRLLITRHDCRMMVGNRITFFYFCACKHTSTGAIESRTAANHAVHHPEEWCGECARLLAEWREGRTG